MLLAELANALPLEGGVRNRLTLSIQVRVLVGAGLAHSLSAKSGALYTHLCSELFLNSFLAQADPQVEAKKHAKTRQNVV